MEEPGDKASMHGSINPTTTTNLIISDPAPATVNWFAKIIFSYYYLPLLRGWLLPVSQREPLGGDECETSKRIDRNEARLIRYSDSMAPRNRSTMIAVWPHATSHIADSAPKPGDEERRQAQRLRLGHRNLWLLWGGGGREISCLFSPWGGGHRCKWCAWHLGASRDSWWSRWRQRKGCGLLWAAGRLPAGHYLPLVRGAREEIWQSAQHPKWR